MNKLRITIELNGDELTRDYGYNEDMPFIGVEDHYGEIIADMIDTLSNITDKF
jgi:hypothetical protein